MVLQTRFIYNKSSEQVLTTSYDPWSVEYLGEQWKAGSVRNDMACSAASLLADLLAVLFADVAFGVSGTGRISGSGRRQPNVFGGGELNVNGMSVFGRAA